MIEDRNTCNKKYQSLMCEPSLLTSNDIEKLVVLIFGSDFDKNF